jgi:pilus assembly protein Flp/PilA
MNKFMTKVANFINDESGPTAVEYAVMLALIIVVCITAVSAVGTSASDKFQEVSGAIDSNGGGN